MTDCIHPELMYFVEKPCGTDWHLARENIHFYSLTFITGGEAYYEIDGQCLNAKEGDIIFIKPGGIRYATTTGMRCVAIDFFLPENQDLTLPLYRYWGSFSDFRMIFMDMNHEWLLKQDGYMMKCQALLMQLLHGLIYDKKKEDSSIYIEQIKLYILQHYTENLTVKQVASHVNLHPTYCGAIFKKAEKQSIIDFIKQVRVNQAKALLVIGHSISDVAEVTGFPNVHYFSNIFKGSVGIPPSTFQKLNYRVK